MDPTVNISWKEEKMSENSKKKVFWTAFGCAQAGQKQYSHLHRIKLQKNLIVESNS